MKKEITLERAECKTVVEVLEVYGNEALAGRIEAALEAGGEEVTLDMSEDDLEDVLDALCNTDDVLERERIRYKAMWQQQVEGNVNDEGFMTFRLRMKDAMNLYAFLAYEADMAAQGGFNTQDSEWVMHGEIGEGLAREILDQGAGNEPYLKREARRAAWLFIREYVEPKGIAYSLKVMNMSEEELCVEILHGARTDKAMGDWYAGIGVDCRGFLYSIIEGAAGVVKSRHKVLPIQVARAVYKAEGLELDEMNEIIEKHPKLKVAVDDQVSRL